MAIQDGQTATAADLIGWILMWIANSIPTGFLECDGSAVSRTTYSGLFALIGTTYGAGNGTTTFNLPDLRGSVAVGAGTKSQSISKAFTSGVVNTTDNTIDFALNHGLENGAIFRFTTTGVLPTYYDTTDYGSITVDGSGNILQNPVAAGLSVNSKIRITSQSSTNFTAPQDYYVISVNGTTSFTVSATLGGSIAGSGNSGSIHFQVYYPLLVATDYYAYAYSASRLKIATSLANFKAGTFVDLSDVGSGSSTIAYTLALTARTIGDVGGEEKHELNTEELAAHVHPPLSPNSDFLGSGSSGGGSGSLVRGVATTGSAGGDIPHNTMQPFVVVKFIIKY